MFKGSRKYWTIAILCGVAAAVLFSFYMQQVKERYQPDDLITVVRAKMDISRDTVVETEMVQIVKVPAKYTHPDALREQKDVVGKIAVNNIAAGEDILAGELLSSNSNHGWPIRFLGISGRFRSYNDISGCGRIYRGRGSC